MTAYIVKRTLQILLVMWVVSVVVFAVIRLSPGDPALARLGASSSDPRLQVTLKTLRSEMGLDRPIYAQYFVWLGKVARFDFGVSYTTGEPVTKMIGPKILPSAELIGVGLLVSVVFAMLLGISSALLHRTIWDRLVQVLSLVGYAIPVFWFGLFLIILFSLEWRILPPGGYVPLSADPVQNLKLVAMPALSIAVYQIGVFTRFLRSEVLDVKSQDFVRVARSKGLRNWTVIWHHVVRNSLIPFVTVVGLSMGGLIGNTVITEQVFGWAGLGWLLLTAVGNRDYAVVQGVVLLMAMTVAVINLVVDITYTYLNPRIVYEKN
jgi:peptide/nickel transport system permease protein